MLHTIKLGRQDALPVAMLAGMVAWFCYEIIFFDQLPFFRDLSTYFYPIKFAVAESFKSWTVPLWDRRMAAGFPLMAGLQSAVFYPPSLVYALLPFLDAIRFSFVFHYSLAVTGAYFLFRSWRISVSTSLLGAVFFGFAGTTVSLSNLLNHFQTAVWLPWMLYSWERAMCAPNWRGIVPFALVGLCQALAGSPEIFLLSIGLLLLDALRMAQEEQLSSIARIAGRMIGAGGLILGLGMVQWLPTAELVMQSRRDQAIHISEALSWSLSPVSLIGLVFPTLEPDASVTAGIRLLVAQSVPFLVSVYIGIVGLFGTVNWLYIAPMKERVVVLSAIAVSVMLSLGSFTPIYFFLYEWVPPLRIFRFPEKYWYLCFCLTAYMVVRGIQRIDEPRKSGAQSVIAVAILTAFLLPYLAFRVRPQLMIPLVSGAYDSSYVADPKTIATILFLLEKQIALSLAMTIAFALYRYGLLRSNLLGAILVAMLFFDLSSVTKPLHFLTDQNIFERVDRIVAKPPEDHGRLFYYPPGKNLHPSFMKVAGNPSYQKATEIALNNLLPNAGVLYGFEYFQDIDALGRKAYTEFLMFINALTEDRRGKLLRALNVKYVIAFHSLNLKELKPIKEFPQHYSVLYEVQKPVPRAYIAQRAVLLHSDAGPALEQMVSEAFDPLQDVVLDAQVFLRPENFTLGKAEIRLYEHRRVLINAQLTESGVLVLADAFYPGWKVFVDGKEQSIRRANLLFRGVELPPGVHEVEFLYDPLSFKVGLAMSLATAMGLILMIIISVLRRRNGTSEHQSTRVNTSGW